MYDLTFVCPSCKKSLKYCDGELFCPKCGKKYSENNGILDFLLISDSNKDMDDYFNSASDYYESISYQSKLYSFYGGIFTHPPKVVVSMINKSIKEGLNNSLNPNNKFILDLACGTGMFTRSIAEKAFHVCGVDSSVNMLKKAIEFAEIKNLKNITFIRASAQELPFQNDLFDGVLCTGALQLFPDLNTVLKEINRVTKNKGRLAALTYIKRGVWKDPEHQSHLKKLGIYFFEVEELEQTLKSNGFYDFKYDIRGSMIFVVAEKIE